MIPFILSFGAMLAAFAVAVGWLFRVAPVSIVWKLFMPAGLVSMALWTPFQVSALMGFPVPSAMSSMPDDAQLIAFVPHDKKKTVDLWLLGPFEQPRAYEVPLTDGLKKTLNQAKDALQQGAQVRLKKQGDSRGDKPSGNYGAAIPEEQHYILKDVRSLPAKD